jgi:hypothetical protein
MPVFNDSNNIPPLAPEGDYVFTVKAFEIGISQGPKTRGADKFTLELDLEPPGQCTESLIDHAATSWKIDCFLKSAGVKLAKGQAFEFRKDAAESQGVLWVNPLGLRGWCKVIQDTIPPKTEEDKKAIAAGTKKPLVVNRVAVFYTDRPKVAAKVQAEEDRPF